MKQYKFGKVLFKISILIFAFSTGHFGIGCVKSNTVLTSPPAAQKAVSFTPSGIPSNNSVYLEEVCKNNDEITLALKVKGGTDVYGAILEINFDGDKIKYVSAEEGSYLNQGIAGTTTFSAGLEQGSSGVLLIGVSKKGIASGLTGDGILVRIVLKAMDTRTKTGVNFNIANSTFKSSNNADIAGISFSGGSLSYQ